MTDMCQCSKTIRDAFVAGGLAAALRAAADEVAPFPGRYPMNEWMEGFRDAKQSVHHQLIAIAAELESAESGINTGETRILLI